MLSLRYLITLKNNTKRIFNPMPLYTINDIDDVTDDELEMSDLVELYTTYRDFFTLSLLNPTRFADEVLIHQDVKEVIENFDQAVYKRAVEIYEEERPDQVPAGLYYILNARDSLLIEYLKAIVGPEYLEEKGKGGLAKNDTTLLENFFKRNRTVWCFIYLNSSELEKAAKSWYQNHAPKIIAKNEKYLKKVDRIERKIGHLAEKQGIQFSSEVDFERFKKNLIAVLEKMDTAMSTKAFKKAVKARISQELTMFQYYNPMKRKTKIQEKQSLFGTSSQQPEEATTKPAPRKLNETNQNPFAKKQKHV